MVGSTVARIDAPEEASNPMNSERKERFKANKRARKADARAEARKVEGALRTQLALREAIREKARLASVGIAPIAVK